jgi:hypothetical protein
MSVPTAGRRGWHTGGHLVLAVRATDDHCGRASSENARIIVWHGPGQGVGENYSDSGQTVPELLNRFGADGWELAGLQDTGTAGTGRRSGRRPGC